MVRTVGLSPLRLTHWTSLRTILKASRRSPDLISMYTTSFKVGFSVSVISQKSCRRANLLTNARANNEYICIQIGQLNDRWGVNDFVLVRLRIPAMHGQSERIYLYALENSHFMYLLDF